MIDAGFGVCHALKFEDGPVPLFLEPSLHPQARKERLLWRLGAQGPVDMNPTEGRGA